MSTLGTFAKYASFAGKKNRGGIKPIQGELQLSSAQPVTGLQAQPDRGKSLIGYNSAADKLESAKPEVMKKVAERANVAVTKDPVKLAKAKERLANIKKIKGVKTRNIIIGSSLGLAGLGTAGAIAYNNRNSNRRSEMSFGSAYANFAEALVGSKSGVSPITGKPYTNKSKKFGEVTDAMRTGTGTPLTPEQLDKLKTSKNNKKQFDKTQIEDTQKSLKAYANQRGIEKQIDSGGDIYKGAKGAGDYVNRTSALLTSPERKAIAAGKTSKNSFVKGLSEGAEKFGRAGYKTGATGLRGVGNALVGRTVTGKVARLGAAGIGLSAIGGAMKRNRQERG